MLLSGLMLCIQTQEHTLPKIYGYNKNILLQSFYFVIWGHSKIVYYGFHHPNIRQMTPDLLKTNSWVHGTSHLI